MKKYIIRVILASVFVLAFFACTEDFEEMNTDPNELTQVPYSSLVSHAQNSIVRAFYPRQAGVVSWSRYEVRNVYVHGDRYEGTGQGQNFFNAYQGHLKDLQVAMKLAAEAEDDNWLAVAKIMTAFSYHIITDSYGDIPYSEALMADDVENPNIFPKYDSQQSIYADLIVQLKAANAMIDVDENIGGSDLVFSGDMMKWKKYANSLLLRVYMRMSRVDPTTAQAGIEEIAGNSTSYPVIDDATDAAFKYWLPEDATYRSPFYMLDTPEQRAVQQNSMAEYIVEFMKARNDTVRLAVYADTAANNGEFLGLPLGTLGFNAPDLSLEGVEEFQSDDTPTRLFRYSEVLFIYAEAALNGWNVGMTAEEAYNAAIQASFDEYGIEIGDYLSEPNVDFNSGADQRELIGDQKWCAMFPDGYQAFAEIRRTGYPTYVATTEPVESLYPGNGVMSRLPYPYAEAIDNPDALAAALAAQPGIIDEKFGAGVWWDID
ncbi:MAG: SusD/RagB family nutrient-binding outer membrane lipoprotein [Bacteroidetes bacterium]|nr:SusD/RagB family nutrient-binding outer membrane lipoprotein [Bacteroidota bacterium]